jgi:hypothetical protein
MTVSSIVDELAPPTAPGRKRSAAPVASLLLLAPILSEVLLGTNRVTTLPVLLPQIGTWGCAALLIREIVRRRGGGWLSILLLGMALAIGEECEIQQTSLAPLVGSNPVQPYGRVLGVNWVYFVWALAYESVWVVVLPIQLAELIFPDRRHESWLGHQGMIIASVVFATASFVAWYLWTQMFVPRFFPAYAYDVPLSPRALALAGIAVLIAVSFSPRFSFWPAPRPHRVAPAAWRMGLAAFLLAFPWFALIFLAYGAMPTLNFLVPLAIGLVWATFALCLFLEWSARSGWTDLHRFASISGALAASMLAGFPILFSSQAPLVDVVGKIVFNGIAIAALVVLGKSLRRSAHEG